MSPTERKAEAQATLGEETGEFAYVSDPSLPAGLEMSKNRFALRVKTDALLEEGIRAGDMVLVETADSPAEGETVAALVRGRAIVRQIFRDADGKVRLETQSRNLTAILADKADVEIRGRVIALVRKYQNPKP